MKFNFRKNHHPLKDILINDELDILTEEIKVEVENEIQTQAFFQKILRKKKYKRRKTKSTKIL